VTEQERLCERYGYSPLVAARHLQQREILRERLAEQRMAAFRAGRG
jgi:hypothetical protein